MQQFKRVYMDAKESKAWSRQNGKKHFFKWFKEWDFIKNGVESGFHPCCIVHFKVRSFFMNLHEWAFGCLGVFDPNKDVKAWYEDQKEEMDKYLNSTWYLVRHPGYVCCPFHTARLYTTQRPYEWHKCGKCGWSQIRFKECKRCTT